MKLGVPGLVLAAPAALFGISVAAAQTAGCPPAPGPCRPPSPPPMIFFAAPPHKNLKVLPADISGPQLIATMKFFSQSLGVRCTFCHVGTDGQPLSTFDFASDAKREKQTARKMLAMVHRINQEDFGVTDFSKVKVTCFTCHRGSQHPETQVPSPPPGATPPGPPAKA